MIIFREISLTPLPLVSYWVDKYAPSYDPENPDYGSNLQFLRKENRSDWYFAGECLAFVYSAIQPVIYFLTGTKLRQVERICRHTNGHLESQTNPFMLRLRDTFYASRYK